MPEGPFGFPRLTGIGPFVEKTEEEEWGDIREETIRRKSEYGIE